jgi:hypothetical protein
LLDNVRKLPRGQLWRHNVSGDLPTDDRVHLDAGKLAQLAAANKGRRGFTYTHHDMTAAGNAEAVRDANAAGFTVNLSANNPAHADKLAELGIAPVVTILPADAPRKLTTPAGRRIVACPAEYTETNCARCGLCARQAADRADIIIGFHVHGTGKKKAAAVAAA